MSSPQSIETTADSIEEAIAKGLAELKVGPSQVIVEVLEEPSAGMFGLPGRPARVRLQVLSFPKPVFDAPPPPPPPPVEPPRVEAPRPAAEPRAERPERESRPERTERPERTDRPDRSNRGERSDRGNRGDRPGGRERPQGERRADRNEERRDRPPRPPKREFQNEFPDYMDVDDEEVPVLTQTPEIPEEEWDDEASIGRVVLNELLSHMDVRAHIAVRRAEAGEQGESTPWVLDIAGSNLQRLIGRRGETLASLQYITRLITSRELQRRSEVIVDVEGYKARRAASLHALALRMADEAVRTSRTIPLEPMPPHERRIIHLALRGRQDVVTKSVGEGVGRKVTIVPSSQA
ncbi:MAG: Jag N-terminal domain-containing protein [Chloroflexi bacterium]|nr:Jag N-terminal domain-containing protein [Chloroflexota bacterium]